MIAFSVDGVMMRHRPAKASAVVPAAVPELDDIRHGGADEAAENAQTQGDHHDVQRCQSSVPRRLRRFRARSRARP